MCAYQKPTWWTREILFAFTHCCTSQQEGKGPREFFIDPEKFHYACLTFDIAQEDRREALGLLAWLAHALSTPEREDETYESESETED